MMMAAFSALVFILNYPTAAQGGKYTGTWGSGILSVEMSGDKSRVQ